MNISGMGLPTVEQERAREEEAARARRGELGRDEFLLLLTAQLQQQNPLDPVDNQAFVAQLSQFASLERLEVMGAALQGLALAQAANTSAQMVSFIGNRVTTASPDFALSAAERPVEFGYESRRPLSELTMTIRDADGRVVRTVSLGAQEAGYRTTTWDGLDQDGQPLPDGDYTVSFQGRDGEGQPVEVTGYTSHVVTGVTYANGFPLLLLANGTESPLGSVREIRGVGDDSGLSK